MSTTEKIEIQLSKSKLTMLLLGSIVFVAIGIWFVTNPPQSHNPILSNPTLILMTGIAAILFFGFCAFFALRKLQDNKPGLIIDQTGITDNASGVSAGHIPWSDIKEIKDTQVINQQFLMILVNNPTKYIETQTNVIKRKAAELNLKNYGSPISISAHALKCNFEELKTLLQTQFQQNKV